MYQLLGDQVVEVEELIGLFKEKGIDVIENITRATKREDAVGLRISLGLSEMGLNRDSFDEDFMDTYMEKAEEILRKKLEGFLEKNFLYSVYAFGYDEVKESILLNFAMMDSDLGRRKLKDVAKRLFDV